MSDETLALLQAANQSNQMAKKARNNDEPLTLFAFTQQLSFLLTIGYLTNEQAAALHDWFDKQGAVKLPDLPGPDGITGPRMYELMATRIHFAPQGGAVGPENIFEDIGHALTSLASTVIDETVRLLEAGTGLLQAGTELLHELHTILAE